MLLGLITNVGTAGSTPTAPPEEAGEWWVGAAQCFATIATAAALAMPGAAVRAQQVIAHDDVVVRQQAPGGGAGASPAVRAQPTTTFVQFWAGDEIVPQGGSPTIVEPDNWQPIVAQYLPPARVALWDADDYAPPQAVSPAFDDGWLLPAQPIVPVIRPVDWDDQVITQAASPLQVDDEGQWPQWIYRQQITPTPQWDDQVTRQAPAPVIDEEPWLRFETAFYDAGGIIWALEEDIVPQPAAGAGVGGPSIAPVRIVRWSAGDELPVQAASLAVDDEAWLLLEPQRTQAFVAGFALPDELPQAPAATIVEDDPWLDLSVQRAQSFAFDLPQPDELPAPIALDEGALLWLQPTSAPLAIALPDVEFEWVPQPPAVANEAYWLDPMLQTALVAPNYAVGSEQDEVVQPPAPLTVDEFYAVSWLPVQPGATGDQQWAVFGFSIGNEDATALVAMAVWPAPADVRAGVVYGPTGTEYVGTAAPGGGAYLRRR